MAYEITLAPEARDDFRGLGAYYRASVRNAINEHLRHWPTRLSKSRIKRLRGMNSPQYRLRVGDLRVFYDVDGTEVAILGIVDKPRAAEWLRKRGAKP